MNAEPPPARRHINSGTTSNPSSHALSRIRWSSARTFSSGTTERATRAVARWIAFNVLTGCHDAHPALSDAVEPRGSRFRLVATLDHRVPSHPSHATRLRCHPPPTRREHIRHLASATHGRRRLAPRRVVSVIILPGHGRMVSPCPGRSSP